LTSNIPQSISDVTGFPEILDGRVKTLHPKIFGGILNRQDNAQDVAELVEFDIPREQPGNPSSPLIPEGRYGMYVFLDGFDSEGQVFLHTSFIGVVRVT